MHTCLVSFIPTRVSGKITEYDPFLGSALYINLAENWDHETLPKTVDLPPSKGLSVIIPAHNEAELIGACLASVLGSRGAVSLEVIVVANGCSDDTADRARAFAPRFADAGHSLTVIETKQGGKLGALNTADAAAQHDARAYLDADVVVTPPLLEQIAGLLNRPEPAYASGQVTIPKARNVITRAYGNFYRKVPFMTHGVPGCGLFAVNAPGRAQWKDWPPIISDDTFARLNFTPSQRHGAEASYDWPLVEGWHALVRVRRRQDAGVAELRRLYPALMTNDDKPGWSPARLARAILGAPAGFLVYAGVALAVRRKGALTDATGWSRGR